MPVADLLRWLMRFAERKDISLEKSSVCVFFLSTRKGKKNAKLFTSPIRETGCDRHVFVSIANHVIDLIVRCSSMISPIIEQMITRSGRFPIVAGRFQRVGEMSSPLVLPSEIDERQGNGHRGDNQQ